MAQYSASRFLFGALSQASVAWCKMRVSPARLDQIWYGNVPAPLWMRVAEQVYRALQPVHQRWQKWRSAHPGRPVIVVGNITAGGTGKTPLLIALVQMLTEAGYRPGVVSRGYGASGRGLRAVGHDSSALAVGDEPLLIHQVTGVPVMVGRDRLAAARALVNDHAVELVLSDDGLQHRRLQRDIEIAVVDGERAIGNGHWLPAGPLRESAGRLDSVDFVVTHGGAESTFVLAGDEAVNMVDGERRNLAELNQPPLHAVAGIGRPQRFLTLLEHAGLQPQLHVRPDHHPYPDSDCVLALQGTVLTTSKDAVKLRGRVGDHWWEIPVKARLAPAFADRFLGRVREVLKQ